MKEDYQKPFKNPTSFFLPNPVPFNGQNYQKKGAWNKCPIALQVTKQFQKNSFISYILSDQVWWFNIKRLLSYFQNCICKFMQANSWHYKLFHFHLSFFIWKVWKGREKFTKVWISRERKELFWWNKKHFSKFWKGCHLVEKQKFDKKKRTQALMIRYTVT